MGLLFLMVLGFAHFDSSLTIYVIPIPSIQ